MKYEFQDRALDEIWDLEEQGERSICVVAPTGSGKGSTACKRVIRDLDMGNRVVFIAPRREIVLDIAKKRLPAMGCTDVGIILAGEERVPKAPVQVCTIQTLLRESKLPKAQTLVMDECHHYVAEQWRELIEQYPKATKIGFTATPQRQDGTGLGDMFTRLIVMAQYSELLKAKLLAPVDLWRPEYILAPGFANSAWELYRTYAHGQTIIFARSVDSAIRTAELFRGRGVTAEAITATTPKKVRDDTIEAYDHGKLHVLVNFDTLTEGVDLPTTETVILMRPYRHVGQYLQAAGRGVRVAKGHRKTKCRLVDATGCSMVLGHPQLDREYTLDGHGISLVRQVFSYGDTDGNARMPLVFEPLFQPKVTAVPREEYWARLVVQVKAGKLTRRQARQDYMAVYRAFPPMFEI